MFSILTGSNPFILTEKTKMMRAAEDSAYLLEMAAPVDRKKEVISMLQHAEPDVIEDIFKVLSRKIIEDAVEEVLNGATRPDSSRKALISSIMTSSKITFDTTIDFLTKIKEKKFDSKIKSLLLSSNSTSFDDLKSWHPFLNAMLEELITTKAGLGSGISKAGDGEYLFTLLGGEKPNFGDVRFFGKEIEIKSDGADLAPSLKAGYPASAKMYSKRTEEATPKGTKYPNKQMTPAGNVKYINQYGYEKWKKFFQNYLDIMFPTVNAKALHSTFWKKLGKTYSPKSFEAAYSWLVFSCMFKDDGLDSIAYVSKNRRTVTTVVDANKVPAEFSFKISQYLIPN